MKGREGRREGREEGGREGGREGGGGRKERKEVWMSVLIWFKISWQA